MDPVVGSVIGAGVSGIANLIGGSNANAQNLLISREANAFNAEQANINRQWSAFEAMKNRSFQERMSNSSYQRAVKDMKDAGLNPMLAYAQGGAGTPGGAQGQSSAASSVTPPRMENVLGNAVNAALPQMRLAFELKKLEADTASSVANAAVSTEHAKKLAQDITIDRAKESRQVDLHSSAKTKADFEESQTKEYGEIDAWLKRISSGADAVGGVVDVIPNKLIGQIRKMMKVRAVKKRQKERDNAQTLHDIFSDRGVSNSILD